MFGIKILLLFSVVFRIKKKNSLTNDYLYIWHEKDKTKTTADRPKGHIAHMR